MLKNLTVKQHIDQSIKQWEFVRDTGETKQVFMDFHIDENPIDDCYLCEIYRRDCNQSEFFDPTEDIRHCKLCPLAPNGLYIECERSSGPYAFYLDRWPFGDFKEPASEIVEILKKHKKNINL